VPSNPRLRRLCPLFPGFSVLQVTATDADSGLNQQLDYRIEGGGQDRFLIDGTTGVIRVANISIDREERDAYRLMVVAVDQGTPALSGTATVSLFIDDVNDCRPEFINPIQTVSVPESAAPGTVVAEVTAIDRDLHPRLEYYLLEIVARDDTDALVPNQQGTFTVDFRTGRRAERVAWVAQIPLLSSASSSALPGGRCLRHREMMLPSCLPAVLLQLPCLTLPCPLSPGQSASLNLFFPFQLSACQVCLCVCAHFSLRAIHRLHPSHPSPSQVALLRAGGCSALADWTRAPLLGEGGGGGPG